MEIQKYCFVFKVNDSKLEKPELLEIQTKKVVERIRKKYSFINHTLTIEVGNVASDILHNTFTLKITFSD